MVDRCLACLVHPVGPTGVVRPVRHHEVGADQGGQAAASGVADATEGAVRTPCPGT